MGVKKVEDYPTAGLGGLMKRLRLIKIKEFVQLKQKKGAHLK